MKREPANVPSGQIQEQREGLCQREPFNTAQETTAELNRREAALLESEARLRTLAEASFEGVGICEDGIIVDANEQLAEMLGYSREELIGKEVIDLIAPESREYVRQVTEGGRTEPYEHFARRKDGSVFPVEVRGRLIHDLVRHLRVTAVRDITARRQAEDRLTILTERLRLATAAADIATWDWNLQTDQIQCDDRMFDMYHWPRAQDGAVTLDQWCARVHPDDLPGQRAALEQTIAEQGRGFREFRILWPDGSIRHIEAADAVITGESGKALRVVGLNIDVTDQKRAEESLRESEKRFRNYFELPVIGLAMTSPDRGFLAVNDQLCRTLGYTREELMQKRWFEMTHPDDLALDEFQFKAMLAGESDGYSLEKRYLRKDGTVIHAAISVRCVRRADGSIDYFIGLVQDITDRKRAESERSDAIRREQQALEDYTRRLIESQESERRRIAGELHDSLGQNLLLIKNRIQQALSSATLPRSSKEQLDAASQLASEAIAEVRHISHDLRPYQIDQLGLTRALEVMIDAAAESTELRFDRRLDCVDQLFSPEQATNLYRVVQECLANVLKHAGARRVRVELDDDVRQVRLWIQDDGRGFARGRETEFPPGGLGLRSVTERARILGGSLKVHSAPGQGTSVEVIIPKTGTPGA